MEKLVESINKVALDLKDVYGHSRNGYEDILVYLAKKLIDKEFKRKSYNETCKSPNFDMSGIKMKSIDELHLDQLRNQIIDINLD